jgi:hypothetical protein
MGRKPVRQPEPVRSHPTPGRDRAEGEEDVSRSLAEQVTYCFGYAVGLHLGAERACDFGKAEINIYGMPTFLLLGFSLENAFAAFLMACEHDKPGDYKSHDLLKAMIACKKYDLIFAKGDRAFVEKLTPFQKDFAFRYPEKLEQGDLGDLTSALQKTKNIIRDVEVGLKIKGYNPAAIAENFPQS